MNNFNKAFEVILFNLCLICWIESVKIQHFSTSIENSFQINQTIDLNCHYNLEDNENITNVVIKHEKSDIVTWKNNSVHGETYGQVHVEAIEKDNTITANIHLPTKDWAGDYTCHIKTDNKNADNQTAEKTLGPIFYWEKDKEVDIGKFNINSDGKTKSINKGDAITIECTAINSSIPFDVIISHESTNFYNYDHKNNKSLWLKNDKIKENDFTHVDGSILKLEGKATTEMKGTFKCEIDFFDDNKSLRKPLDGIKIDINAGKINNISISIMTISFISIFYSMLN